MFKDYVIDLTMGIDDHCVCFIPYDKASETFYTGFNILDLRCPGNLVGVVHFDDNNIAERWTNENPDWYNKYKQFNDEQNPERSVARDGEDGLLTP